MSTDGRTGDEAANSSSTGSSNPATIINNPAIAAAAYAINGDGGSDGGSDSSGERGAYFRTPLAAKQRLQETQFDAGSKTRSGGGGSGGGTSSSSSNDGVTDFSYVQDRGRSKSPPLATENLFENTDRVGARGGGRGALSISVLSGRHPATFCLC